MRRRQRLTRDDDDDPGGDGRGRGRRDATKYVARRITGYCPHFCVSDVRPRYLFAPRARLDRHRESERHGRRGRPVGTYQISTTAAHSVRPLASWISSVMKTRHPQTRYVWRCVARFAYLAHMIHGNGVGISARAAPLGCTLPFKLKL